MKRSFATLFLAGLILLLAACGGPATQPLVYSVAPWAAGEVSSYDVIGRDGAPLGSASWTWRRNPEGWTQAYELSLAGRADRGEVMVGADLAAIRSWRELGGKRFEAEYGADAITITTTGVDDKSTSKTLKPPADAVDNDVSLQIQRALPLAAGYAAGYTDVIPTTGASAPVRLKVTGAETITVPAGTFPAWRVEMDFGSGKHDAWYGQDAPYPLVRYLNRGSGTAFALRSLGTSLPVPATAANATPVSPQAPGAAAAAASTGPSSINIPLLLSSFLIQLPLMLAFPIVLGWWIRRRYGVGWGIFWAGALTFVVSQVVHLPLNYALGLLGGSRGVALWPLPLMALVAGLSAGVCEEGARWITLRFFLKRARGWRAGLQFGAGHGGGEAIIFGLLVAVNLLTMLVLSSVNPAALGLPAAAADQISAASAIYWRSAWYLPIVGGVERLFAITIQIALAEVVMLSFTRRNIAYLFAAIGLHTLVDFWAVWGMATLGMVWVEVGVAVFAVAAFWLIRRLRDAPVAPAATPLPAPAPTAADLPARVLSPEELARRAEESRYE
ncbi:MAG: YhfC family glutamic-type intramembrane protease [Anaerolineae bacterium]|jgi:uncharacterized membrane protein YhfC|nr:YhfC family glutamic-type intramembrane protease [Anaerolineae bacterium]